jgi:glycerol-3-phosphate acyltransferase PlsY
MQLADESYTIILIFSIVAIILSIIILLCFRHRDAIANICKKNQVVPETVYLKKPPELKIEVSPV